MSKIFWGRWSLRLFFGALVSSLLASACSFCVHPAIPQQAVENGRFCAEYLKKNDLVAAEARCKIAIEYSPKYAEAYNLLGIIEYNYGHADKAAELFKRAISLRNDFAEAYNNLGGVFKDRGDIKQACSLFKEAVEIDPGYVTARLNLGNCYFYHNKEKDFRRAGDEYRKCVELDPNECDCWLGLGGIAAQKQSSMDQALKYFTKMTMACPKNPNGFYNVCWADYNLSRYDEAQEACVQALALKPEHQEARSLLTEVQNRLALQDASISEYTAKIRLNPGDPELHFNLGIIYNDKKLKDYALNEFLSVIKLNSKYTLAYYWAAKIYDDQLHTDETIQKCKEFINALDVDQYPAEKRWCLARVNELQYQE